MQKVRQSQLIAYYRKLGAGRCACERAISAVRVAGVTLLPPFLTYEHRTPDTATHHRTPPHTTAHHRTPYTSAHLRTPQRNAHCTPHGYKQSMLKTHTDLSMLHSHCHIKTPTDDYPLPLPTWALDMSLMGQLSVMHRTTAPPHHTTPHRTTAQPHKRTTTPLHRTTAPLHHTTAPQPLHRTTTPHGHSAPRTSQHIILRSTCIMHAYIRTHIHWHAPPPLLTPLWLRPLA